MSDTHTIKEFLSQFIKQSQTTLTPQPSIQVPSDDDDEPNSGLDTILESSRKLMHINQGLVDPDERDSLTNKRIYNTNELMAERVRMDAGKLSNSILRKLNYRKNLQNLPPGFLDSYAEKHIVGNALSLPLEEINPMHLYEQAHRITQMGLGGIGSESAISTDAQNVHPSEFGFFDPWSGPESGRAGIDVRATENSRLGTDGKIYQKFFDRKNKRYVWLSPSDLDGKTIRIPD